MSAATAASAVIPIRPLPLSVVPTPAQLRQLQDLLTVSDPQQAWRPVPAEDPATAGQLCARVGTTAPAGTAVVMSTSGSTGPAKGIYLTPTQLRSAIVATEQFFGGGGVWVLALPSWHIAGLQVLLRSLHAGYTPIVVDISTGFDPTDLVAAAAAVAAPRSFLSLVPGQLTKALETVDAAVLTALAQFTAVLVGGASCPPELVHQAQHHGITVVRTYGASETCGGVVYDGVPLPGVTLSLRAPTPTPTGQQGQLVISGPMVATGYSLPGTHDELGQGRWVTSDLAELSPTGQLRICGRLDGLLTVGGLKVNPQRVEELALTHPQLHEICVVGVPHPRLGTQLVAAVVADADLTRAELAAHLRAGGGGHETHPRIVRRVPQLPLMGIGKLDRQTVAQWAQEWVNEAGEDEVLTRDD